EANMEYAANGESLRLGAIRLELLADRAWQEWDRQRLQRTGGTLGQYKHPCLIGDLNFRETITVEEELPAPPGEPAARDRPPPPPPPGPPCSPTATDACHACRVPSR